MEQLFFGRQKGHEKFSFTRNAKIFDSTKYYVLVDIMFLFLKNKQESLVTWVNIYVPIISVRIISAFFVQYTSRLNINI